MKRCLYPLIITLIIVFPLSSEVYAQKIGQDLIDSFETVLPRMREDTNKVKALTSMALLLRRSDPEKQFRRCKEALELATRIKWENGIAEANSAIGNYYADRDDYEKALKHLSIAVEINKRTRNITREGKNQNNIGGLYMRQGDFVNAEACFAKALTIWKQTNNKQLEATASCNIAMCYFQEAKFDKARNCYEHSLEISKELSDNRGVAKCMMGLADIEIKEGNYNNGLEKYFTALKIMEENNDKRSMGNLYQRIALVLKGQLQFEEAHRYHKKSLETSLALNDKLGEAMDYVNLAESSKLLHQYAEAEEYAKKAIEIFNQVGNKKFEAVATSTLASVYSINKNYADALKMYRMAFQHLDKNVDRNNVIASNKGCFDTYLSMLKEDDLASLKAIGITKDTAFLRAKYHIDQCITLSALQNDKLRLEDFYESAAELSTLSGDYKSGYEYMLLHDSLRYLVFSESNMRIIAGIKEQYETEKKDREIQLLTKEGLIQALKLKQQSALVRQRHNELLLVNQARKLQEFELENKNYKVTEQKLHLDKKEAEVRLLNRDKQLQADIIEQERARRTYLGIGFMLIAMMGGAAFYYFHQRKKILLQKQISDMEMKALRSQMNPHFIFNTFNSVHRYLQENDIKSASQYLGSFSNLTRLVLENSLEKAIPIADELEALRLYLELESLRMHKSLGFEINVSPDIDMENTLVPPLILQPFVENSIWHGLNQDPEKEQPKIKINIEKHGGMLKCYVEDNGVGLGKASRIKANFQHKKKGSLGMKLTQQRLELLNKLKNANAYVTVSDNGVEDEETGVRVELALPLEYKY